MRRATISLGFGLVVLVGCATFPDLDVAQRTSGSNAGFPELIPIDPLLLAASDSGDTAAQVAALTRRVSLLRARARAMQRPVIDRRTRRILAAKVRRLSQ